MEHFEAGKKARVREKEHTNGRHCGLIPTSILQKEPEKRSTPQTIRSQNK